MDSIAISKDRLDYTIDLLTSLTVNEIAKATGRDANQVLTEFISSKTGQALYDESTRIWCNGPSYIADMYFDEVANR